MSVAHVSSGGNVLHPQAPRPADVTRLMEVDTGEVSIEVTQAVVMLALGASSEKDAGIINGTKRANGHTIEFTSRETRDAALKAMREYGQLPCTRGAEMPPWRNLTRVHAIDCVAWVQNGKCSMDGKCPFRHPPPVARVPCRHWIRNHGECWYAEHCNFLHPGSAALRNVHDTAKGHSGGDSAGAGPALQSPPQPMPPRRSGPTSNPWAHSTSVIPTATSSLPSSPREIPDSASNNHRVIGSPWTNRAAKTTPRPPSPDIFGRPANRNENTDQTFGAQLSSSISSVDDEIISTGLSRTLPTDSTPVPPHTTPRVRSSATEPDAESIQSVWQNRSGSRFESKRLDFGVMPAVSGSDDDSAVVAALRLQLSAKDSEINRLTETLIAKDQQIAFLSSQLAAFHDSTNQNSNK
mmetsp:Transcript_31069/g.43474  ORF Transcript_31069/g.43474 Transcript_31069/m.43474 type:complete len:409 (+) Transcript_31069:1-1227(+)